MVGVLGIAAMVQVGVSIFPVHNAGGQFSEAMFVGMILAICLGIDAGLLQRLSD